MKITDVDGVMKRKETIQHKTRLVSHESRRAEIPRANHDSRKIVYAIVSRTPPIKRHLRGNRGLGIQCEPDGWPDISKIGRAKKRRKAGIHGVRKQRVECV